ncbi:hypothetical protein [Streptomyces graminofaciens]|nr:hypothetical protein [Streptomyces graminofaciens]
MRRAGGLQLTTTSTLHSRAPAHPELRLPDEALMTWFPDTSRFCDGSQSSEPTLQRDVAATGDVVIITGPMADADCVGPVTVRRSTARGMT